MKELEWAISRPKSKAHGLTVETVLEKAASTGCTPFDLAQTQKEDEHECGYYGAGVAGLAPDIAVQPNQNPRADRGIHSPSNSIRMCIIKNSGLIKVKAMGRWLLWKELALYQGFAVRPRLATPRSQVPRQLCSFCPGLGEPEDSVAPWHKRSAGTAMVGNAMNHGVIAALFLFTTVFHEFIGDAHWKCPACGQCCSS